MENISKFDFIQNEQLRFKMENMTESEKEEGKVLFDIICGRYGKALTGTLAKQMLDEASHGNT